LPSLDSNLLSSSSESLVSLKIGKKDDEKVGEEAGEEVGKEVGKEVSEEVGKEISKDIGEEVGKEVDKKVDKEVDEEVGKEVLVFIKNQFSNLDVLMAALVNIPFSLYLSYQVDFIVFPVKYCPHFLFSKLLSNLYLRSKEILIRQALYSYCYSTKLNGTSSLLSLFQHSLEAVMLSSLSKHSSKAVMLSSKNCMFFATKTTVMLSFLSFKKCFNEKKFFLTLQSSIYKKLFH